MSGHRGAVVIDERVLPIVDVRLLDEAVCMVVEVWGPARGLRATSYTVHDEAGAVVYRSEGTSVIDLPELQAGSRITMQVWARVEGKTASRTHVFQY